MAEEINWNLVKISSLTEAAVEVVGQSPVLQRVWYDMRSRYIRFVEKLKFAD